ncbi:hypothetical protein BGZ76_001084 [Entomortierella beljakovae]|nr:hypothetical protein BGZ76_001084 [Entomortierella beljakovae]
MFNSFGQARFWKSFVKKSGYTHDEIPDQTGKVAIVTGANTGLGYSTAKTLAGHGAQVFLACRNKEKGLRAIERAREEIKNEYPQLAIEPKLEFLELDLNDMNKTRQAAKEFLAKNLPLHILICNAGIMLTPYELSANGIENQFAVNHMGHFVFTLELLDRIKESQPAKIVMLSSNAHEPAPRKATNFELEAINDEKLLSSFERYYRSKLCVVMFSNALARRLENEKIYVNSLNPGYVNTELSRYAHDTFGKTFVNAFNKIGNATLAMKPQHACLTPLYLATSPDVENKDIRGRYFIPIAHEIHPSAYARNVELQEKLWTFSEKLVQEKIGSLE